MRLLNTTTVELCEFVSKPPPYAILSHTWDGDEVTFQDLDLKRPGVVQKKGYSKILGACNRARAHASYAWIWIDTCCIDKSSSAELSEAINSMFQWYENAETCFVYLSDVQDSGDTPQFLASRWHTRGWTLQELLAPRDIEFYTASWEAIGKRADLEAHIVSATGIDPSYLLRARPLSEASVAQRMSWASQRRTTREEDIAYCLLGVFGVNMPLIYGEGSLKAFLRLQEEIMRNCDDQSILAWGWGIATATSRPQATSYLAQTPQDFAHAGDIVSCRVIAPQVDLIPTHRGLILEAPICRPRFEAIPDIYTTFFLPLKCRPRDEVLGVLAIPVVPDLMDASLPEYRRTRGEVILVPNEVWDAEATTVARRYLRRTKAIPRFTAGMRCVCAVRSIPAGFEINETWPAQEWRLPTPTPDKPMGRWTKAVWRPGARTGYLRLKWIAQTGPAWPDVLFYVLPDRTPGRDPYACGLVLYPEGGACLPDIVDEFEVGLVRRGNRRSVPGLEQQMRGHGANQRIETLCTHRLDIGSRYITATAHCDEANRETVAVDVRTSSCPPWSLDDSLGRGCGLELQRPEAANGDDMRD